jgi:hypothetical protein
LEEMPAVELAQFNSIWLARLGCFLY